PRRPRESIPIADNPDCLDREVERNRATCLHKQYKRARPPEYLDVCRLLKSTTRYPNTRLLVCHLQQPKRQVHVEPKRLSRFLHHLGPSENSWARLQQYPSFTSIVESPAE